MLSPLMERINVILLKKAKAITREKMKKLKNANISFNDYEHSFGIR